MLASAADSGLDVAASAATFFAVRYAAVPPDAEHRFGHGKAEAFSSLLQAGLVFASAALIGQEAARHIFRPAPVSQEGWAIGVMMLSMVLTGGLVAAQTVVLRRGRSVAVSGDRMHYVTDLASNVVALAGIGAVALFGSTTLDAVAGLIVAGILLWGAIVVFRQASNELMDRELPDEDRARIAAPGHGRSPAGRGAPSSAPGRRGRRSISRCTPIWSRTSPSSRPIRSWWRRSGGFWRRSPAPTSSSTPTRAAARNRTAAKRRSDKPGHCSERLFGYSSANP